MWCGVWRQSTIKLSKSLSDGVIWGIQNIPRKTCWGSGFISSLFTWTAWRLLLNTNSVHSSNFTLPCWCWCWHSQNCLLCLVWLSVTTNTEHWLWQHIIIFEKKLSPSIKIRLPASSLGFQNLLPSHCWNDFWI